MTILHAPISNATNAETQEGLSTVKLVTPASLYSAITNSGNVKTAITNLSSNSFDSKYNYNIASPTEVSDGVNTYRLVTPSSLLNAINNTGAVKTAVSTIATAIATTIANTQIANALPVRTYKDVTATRQQDVTYTNTTNTDLIVIVNVVGGVNFIHSLYAGGLIVCSRYAATSAGYVYYGTLEATVPKGSTYLYNSSLGGQIQQWIELSAN
jgi:hypothetical protein